MTTRKPRTIETETVEGHDEHGRAISTRVWVEHNLDWTEATADVEHRYLTRAIETNGEGLAELTDADSFDSLDDARDWVKAVLAEASERYAGLEADRRQEMADGLGTLAEDLALGGTPELTLLLAVAKAIGKGKATQALAALKAARLA